METNSLRIGDVIHAKRPGLLLFRAGPNEFNYDRIAFGDEAGVCLVVSNPEPGYVSIRMGAERNSYYVMRLLIISSAYDLCLYTTGKDGIDDSWNFIP